MDADQRVTEKRSLLPVRGEPLFENPFLIEDLAVFDDEIMKLILRGEGFGVKLEDLALSMHGVSDSLVRFVMENMPSGQHSCFMQELRRPVSTGELEEARKRVLDALFWELTYWKTPDLYEELTEGEQLHPGIFQSLEPDVRGKVVLDVGAGSGRATFECLRHEARLVYAVEPSPGLLRILRQKLAGQPENRRIHPCKGRFDCIPLEDNSVDVALSCSAFTAEPEQGGEPGLAELRRVTKPGGKIVLIWPRVEDYDWLTAHGFHYIAIPARQEMCVHFRSLPVALQVARRFYAHNQSVVRYLVKRGQPEVPFSVLGFNPPRDFCWMIVE